MSLLTDGLAETTGSPAIVQAMAEAFLRAVTAAGNPGLRPIDAGDARRGRRPGAEGWLITTVRHPHSVSAAPASLYLTAGGTWHGTEWLPYVAIEDVLSVNAAAILEALAALDDFYGLDPASVTPPEVIEPSDAPEDGVDAFLVAMDGAGYPGAEIISLPAPRWPHRPQPVGSGWHVTEVDAGSGTASLYLLETGEWIADPAVADLAQVLDDNATAIRQALTWWLAAFGLDAGDIAVAPEPVGTWTEPAEEAAVVHLRELPSVVERASEPPSAEERASAQLLREFLAAFGTELAEDHRAALGALVEAAELA